MKFVFALTFLLLAATLMVSETSACVCTADYNPVCATDGHTYGNRCAMTCGNAEYAHDGPCNGAR